VQHLKRPPIDCIIISAFYFLLSVMRLMKTTHLRFTRERFGVAGELERFSSAYTVRAFGPQCEPAATAETAAQQQLS